MNGLLEGKAVVITDAGSGVGHAAALLFARHGAQVLALDIDLAAAEATAAEVTEEGGTAFALGCNVADAAEVTAAIAAAAGRFGRLDVMYNNAGITTSPPPGKNAISFIEGTPDQMDRLVQVNLGGVVNGCRAAIRQFQSQGGLGVIVNTASVAGLIGWGSVIYGATKGAVTTLTRALALEMAPLGIRVNSVCPAAMMTKFGIGERGPISDEMRGYAAKLHPLGRTIDPVDCANAALFLASDLASNITGVNLPVDGGMSAGR
jgi:NAD(P)-dependent dehydrogenase (short-subunit alcohol dehydrogenase family)